jgi:hypothetical protein
MITVLNKNIEKPHFSDSTWFVKLKDLLDKEPTVYIHTDKIEQFCYIAETDIRFFRLSELPMKTEIAEEFKEAKTRMNEAWSLIFNNGDKSKITRKITILAELSTYIEKLIARQY